MNVAARELRAHALLQRAVNTGYRQSGEKVVIDILILVGIAQKLHLELGRDIVVKRQTAAVRKTIARSVQAQARDELTLNAAGILCRSRAVACRGRYLIVHRLSIEVVALLEHTHKDLIDGVETVHDAVGILWLTPHADGAREREARASQGFEKLIHEYILPLKDERREHGVVIVPAPAFTQEIRVFHRAVGIEIAPYRVNTHLVQSLGEGLHVITCEARIKAPHAIDVAVERRGVDPPCVAQLRLKLIAAAETVEGRDGRDRLHRGSRTHELTLIVTEDGRVGVKVIDHDAHLRGLEHVALEQLFDLRLHVLWPGKGVVAVDERVAPRRIGHRCGIVVIVVVVNIRLSDGRKDGTKEKEEKRKKFILHHIPPFLYSSEVLAEDRF